MSTTHVELDAGRWRLRPPQAKDAAGALAMLTDPAVVRLNPARTSSTSSPPRRGSTAVPTGTRATTAPGTSSMPMTMTYSSATCPSGTSTPSICRPASVTACTRTGAVRALPPQLSERCLARRSSSWGSNGSGSCMCWPTQHRAGSRRARGICSRAPCARSTGSPTAAGGTPTSTRCFRRTSTAEQLQRPSVRHDHVGIVAGAVELEVGLLALHPRKPVRLDGRSVAFDAAPQPGLSVGFDEDQERAVRAHRPARRIRSPRRRGSPSAAGRATRRTCRDASRTAATDRLRLARVDRTPDSGAGARGRPAIRSSPRRSRPCASSETLEPRATNVSTTVSPRVVLPDPAGPSMQISRPVAQLRRGARPRVRRSQRPMVALAEGSSCVMLPGVR